MKSSALMLLGLMLALFWGGAVSYELTGCSTPAARARTAKVETDLCVARADYKLAAAVAGGRLDPAPGSARAKLEQAEDAFCAARGGDGGP